MPKFTLDTPDTIEDYEYTAEIEGVTIHISKVGGGTVGQAYTGNWHYHVVTEAEGWTDDDLVTGSPTTHEGAAEEVACVYLARVERITSEAQHLERQAIEFAQLHTLPCGEDDAAIEHITWLRDTCIATLDLSPLKAYLGITR